MMHEGVPISISSDDPCFFDYEGVTLDYAYVFLAWELTIADLKQLCLNSLEYSTIDDGHKAKLRVFFEERWRRFLELVRGKY
jgi:adenosine deaminase CECR1